MQFFTNGLVSVMPLKTSDSSLTNCARQDMNLAKKVRDLLSSDRITISTSTDVIGIELVGALKNVLAIAMGIVTGSDMGDNSRAALLTYVRTYIFFCKLRLAQSSRQEQELKMLNEVVCKVG